MNENYSDDQLLEDLCSGKSIRVDQAFILKRNYKKYQSAYIKQNLQEEKHEGPFKIDEHDESLKVDEHDEQPKADENDEQPKVDEHGEPLKVEIFAFTQFLNALPQISIYLLDLSNKAAFDNIFNGYMTFYVIGLMIFFYLMSYNIYIFVDKKTKIKSIIGAVFTTTIIVGNVLGEIISKSIYKEEESYEQMGISFSIQCGLYIFSFIGASIYETKCCTRQGSMYIRDY